MFTFNLQVGGSDQMGNIVSGHDLISRAEDKKVYGKLLFLMVCCVLD
jgi:tyrosyl-tRNA synthetase